MSSSPDELIAIVEQLLSRLNQSGGEAQTVLDRWSRTSGINLNRGTGCWENHVTATACSLGSGKISSVDYRLLVMRLNQGNFKSTKHLWGQVWYPNQSA